MKNRFLLILICLLTLLSAFSAVYADYDNWYPIGGGDPSYPIPHYDPGKTDPYNNQSCGQPYYDPYSGKYVYPNCPQQPISLTNPVSPLYPVNPQPPCYPQPCYPQPCNPQPYNPQPYNPQPYNPQPYDPGNVQAYTEWYKNGIVKLTWTVRNVTNENWNRNNFDIKCVSGCDLLNNPWQTLWDVPYTVNRNDSLTFSVLINQSFYGETMTFAIVAGSKTVYTFTVRPF